MEISKCMGCMSEFRGYPCPNCGFAPGTQKGQEFALPPETILAGKYLVGRVLGQGGFGITYIGWDLSLERKVAIKEYYPSGQVSRAPGTKTLTWYTSDSAQKARQDGMQMFLKEARKMAKLEDIPGVVKVRELFQENETAYIVMDFVEGKTLKSILQKNGPMGWEQAKNIFLPAIKAMETVHGAGLVHRDISPDNLMITQDGSVRILDLGAAKDLNINSGTSSMQVAKNGFSPPEQYIQRGGSGPWTDVYAMAATIYFTLTCKLPPMAMDRVMEDDISWNLPGLNSLPTPALEALKRAMAVQAKSRTQTMAELEAGLLGASGGAKPKSLKQKKPLPKWLIPVVAAVVLVAGIGIWAKVVKPAMDYKAAQALMDTGEYDRAAEAFETLGDYRDSAAKAQEANYQAAQALMNAGEYDKAADAFEALGDYQNSAEKAQEASYQAAQALLNAGEYDKAAEAFEALGNYRDSAEKALAAKREVIYLSAQRLLDAGEYDQAAEAFVALGDYRDSADKAKESIYQKARMLMDSSKYLQAMWAFSGLDYKDSADMIQKAKESYQVVQRAVSLDAGYAHTVALRSNGTVVAAGDNDNAQRNVSDWSDIVAVAAGGYHTVGLRSDGTVVAAGKNNVGQCNVNGWKDIVAIAAGGGHTVGLRSAGTVVATKIQGKDSFESSMYECGQSNVSGWRNIVAVAAGEIHTVGLRSDGTVVTAGANFFGECNVSGWTDVVAIAAGDFYSVCLRSDGTLVASGSNDDGECNVSSWTDIVAVAAGLDHTVGLRSDGTVMATGSNEYGQCNVSGWSDIIAVAAGCCYTVGLRSDGTLVSTERNEKGQCDVGGWKDIRTPQPIP